MGKVAKKELVRIAFPDAFALEPAIPVLLTPAGVLQERDALAQASIPLLSSS